MQKVLRKRIFRDLKENLGRYLALGLMIILCMYIIVALIGAADSLMIGINQFTEEYQLEDGEFQVFVPLTEKELAKLEEKGVTIEEQFYLDFQMEDESTVRVFQNREAINLVKVEQGRSATKDTEIVLEKRYCEEHELQVGDEVKIGGYVYEIVGIGLVPDYDSPVKEFSDSTVDSVSFGLGFVTEASYDTLLHEGKSKKAEEYVYAYLLNDAMTDAELKEYLSDVKVETEDIQDEYFLAYYEEQVEEKEELEEGIEDLVNGASELTEGLTTLSEFKTGIQTFDEGLVEAASGAGKLTEGIEELQDGLDEWLKEYDVEISNLVQYVKVDDNPRVGASVADQEINKAGGIIAGIIVIVLFAYVISVFVVYGIEKESSTIGTLYALGVKRRELVRHYLILPVLITFLFGIIGTALGMSKWGVEWQMADCYMYYSIPEVQKVLEPYLFVYAIVMPPVMAIVVNYLVINKKLKKPALQLIRNEQKQNKIRNIQIPCKSFVRTFQIRQMLREIRTSFTVVIGMFIALLILMLGVDCYALCNNISEDYKEDTKFEYMYTYKYPTEQIPEDGYEAYAKSLKKENLGYNLDVTVLGLTKENPFFDVNLEKSKSEVIISSAMAQKFGIKVGEIITLEDAEMEINYAFTVKDIVQYATSFYVFMDIESAREIFGENEDYYNVVFSSKELNIDSGRLYAITTRDDIVRGSDVFIEMLSSMIIMMTGIAVLIFAVVMYLMMKVMIDRSAFHISMVKVFGYRMKEIKKLYLNGNFYIVAVGAAICIPLAKLCMDAMYPWMVSNVACAMDLQFSWKIYALIYGGIIVLYFIINQVLVGKLKKVNLAEVLKNRE